MKKKIAVIGAGFSGIVLSKMLKNIAEVKIFEKSRGVGGRMACRIKDDFNFDFGAQFFIAKTRDFKKFLEPLIDKGVIKYWSGNFVEIDNYKINYQRQWNEDKSHFVPVPKMNSLCKELSQDLDLVLQTKITKIQRNNNQWQIFDDKENFLGEFDWVISSIPAPQLIDIAPQDCNFYDQLSNVKMLGCFALMVGLEQKLDLPYDVGLIKNSIISWISSESSKPQRSSAPSYTILARNNWADHHIDCDIEEVKQNLLSEFAKIVNQKLPTIIHTDIHRWRYANIPKQHNFNNYFLDSQMSIGACGDWFIQGRVEASFLSATKLFNNLSKILN